MTDTLEDKYKLITYEIEDLLDKLKLRDDLWIDIGKETQGNNYSNEKIDNNIKEKVEEEVIKRKKVWDIITDVYNKNKGIFNEEKGGVQCEIDDKGYSESVKSLTLQRRRYAFMDYDILVRQENIKLLYLCILTLTFCLILLVLNMFNLLSFIIVITLYLCALISYILYVIKVVVLDRVNRNNIFFNKLDFNKPTETEIEESKAPKDENGEDSSCKDDIYGRGATSYKTQFDDEVLDKIKASTTIDAAQCLV